VKAVPALTVGGVLFTVTVTLACAKHPVAVIVLVTVYVVVTSGLAFGLLIVAELNPVVGLHEYVASGSFDSPIVAPDVFDVQVFVKGEPALTVGNGLTVTNTEFE
jgi:hypothetical protein